MLHQGRIKQKLAVWLNGYFFVCAFLLVFSPVTSIAQDKIYKTDNTIIQAKVQEVGDADIRYKKFSNLNGPVYNIKKEYVRMIIYENGEKEIYSKSGTNQQVQKPPEIKHNDINTPADQFNNADLIVTANGDNIYCTIDKVSIAMISYHIKRRGADPKGTIALKEVIKYTYNQQWYYGMGVNSSTEKARDFILSEKINDAIALYFLLISNDSTNATLLAEDAYALALGGIYEAALMRLDRSWSIGTNSPEVNYFTAQVFSLMGFDELASEFWKVSEKYKTPAWISSESSILLQKFKSKSSTTEIPTREGLIANFKHANELASKNLNFQSIALFHKIIDLLPNEYLPYIGYSTVLERAGAIENSAKAIEKAISLIGDNSENKETKQILEQRLVMISRKLASVPRDAMPGLSQAKVPEAFSPQMMAYAGGMVAPDIININGRIGYFISGSGNASFDFGVAQNAGTTSVNLGLSGYYRKNSLVCGAGLMLYSGNANTTLSIKISVGVSIRNRNQTSSFDIFLDGYTGLAKNSLTTVGLSIGKSIYFGKRK